MLIKKHLPMMGVGPVYVAVIIIMTVIAVIMGRNEAFEKGRVVFLKIPLLMTGILQPGEPMYPMAFGLIRYFYGGRL